MFKLETISPLGYLMPKLSLGIKYEDSNDGGGGGDKGWIANLPDDIKADPVFEKYKEPNEAHRALVEAQKFLGREKLPVPADENDAQTYSMIFKRLGLPENADGYILPTDIQIPKELPFDDKIVAGFKKTAHELGILPKQFAGIYKWYLTEMVNSFNQLNQQRDDDYKGAETDLRKEWGAAYQQNQALANKVLATFGDAKAHKEIIEKFGNNPVLIKLFANIGKVLSEDQLTGRGSESTETPAEALAEIKKMEADLKGPLFDDTHPQHSEYKEKRDRLYKLAYPAGQ